MSGRELDENGDETYHPDRPWEQAGHPDYVEHRARTKANWPPSLAAEVHAATTAAINEATGGPIKLGDLNASHLGKTITISYPGDSITGTLAGVHHHAPVIDETRLASIERELHLGRARTTISILGWGERDWACDTECTVGA